MASKKKERATLWPLDFANVEVPGKSPLSSIWIIGDKGTGKSTTIATIPAKNPLMIDLEASYTTLQFLRPMTRVDLNELVAGKAHTSKNIYLNLFETFWEYIQSIPAGTYDVIGVDTFNRLWYGMFNYVVAHPDEFGRVAAEYSGKEGTMFKRWPDTKELASRVVKLLESKCQTVVFASHIRDEFVDNRRSGNQTWQGPDIRGDVSLVLWLFNDRMVDPEGRKPGEKGFKGCYWAYNEKDRLTYHIPTDNGHVRIANLLPRKLVPTEPGQTLAEVIYGYMAAPKPDYGELNQVIGDPTRSLEGDAEQEARKAELQYELALNNAKMEMAHNLINKGFYTSMGEIAQAISDLNLDADVQIMSKIPSVEKALRENSRVPEQVS